MYKLMTISGSATAKEMKETIDQSVVLTGADAKETRERPDNQATKSNLYQ